MPHATFLRRAGANPQAIALALALLALALLALALLALALLALALLPTGWLSLRGQHVLPARPQP
jgi:hypothetical protein